MEIPDIQLDGPAKKIGTLKGRPVFYSKTKGGWHVINCVQQHGAKTIGLGAHKALATHIAQKMEPEIEWTELSKSDHVDFSALEPFVEKYTQLTLEAQRIEASKE